MELIKTVIREVPDFPKPGILFYDITTLLADPDAFSTVIDRLEIRARELGVEAVVGMESRGFIFGTPLALRLGVPFVPVRKAGKLPWKTEAASYSLEYGEATIEIHQDALKPGQKTLIVDDLLATGGTAAATIDLVERLGAVVARCMFVIELGFLEGRAKLPEGLVESLIVYDE